MPKFVLLWTYAAIWLLLLMLVAYAVVVLRSPGLTSSWRKVFHDAAALASSVVLALCLLITLLDSLHYRPLLPPAEGANSSGPAYDVRTRSVLDRIPDGRKVSLEREIFPAMAADNRMFAMPTSDYWIDTGQPDLYLAANLDIIGRVRASHNWATAVAPGASIAHDATVTNAVICGGADVRSLATVSDSVLLPGALVGPGAVVRGSIVMGHVGAGAHIDRCVIGAGVVIADGALHAGERIPPAGT